MTAALLGRSVPLSLGRRVICDLMQVAGKIPRVPIQKEMDVAAIAAARGAAAPRPSWCGIFTKAYAQVVANRPELRRAFLTFPWQRMFEYNAVSADIVVDTEFDGERTLAFALLKHPDSRSLAEIDQLLDACKQQPWKRNRRFRRTMLLAYFPSSVRRLVWWSLLNVSAWMRAPYFSTFAVSSMANWGVDLLAPIGPNTSHLHYGVVDAQGKVMVRLTFDHRVMDGSTASKALNEMEQCLNTDIVAEVKALRPGLAA